MFVAARFAQDVAGQCPLLGTQLGLWLLPWTGSSLCHLCPDGLCHPWRSFEEPSSQEVQQWLSLFPQCWQGVWKPSRTGLPTPVSELHLPCACRSVTQQNAVRAELLTFPVLLQFCSAGGRNKGPGCAGRTKEQRAPVCVVMEGWLSSSGQHTPLQFHCTVPQKKPTLQDENLTGKSHGFPSPGEELSGIPLLEASRKNCFLHPDNCVSARFNVIQRSFRGIEPKWLSITFCQKSAPLELGVVNLPQGAGWL